MKKRISLFCFILVTTTGLLFGQQLSNINFDEIQSQTQDSSSPFYYPLLIQRFLQFDTTLTERDFKFIYYGNVYTDKYTPYGTKEDEKKFTELYKKEKYQEAIPLGQKALLENAVNLNVLYKLLVCFHALGDKATAQQYANLYFGLLGEIYRSGDGESVETAYVVIKINDEYQLLNELELQSVGQSLLAKGPTDLLTIDTKNQKKVKGKKKIKELYFNVAKPFGHMAKQFKKSE